MRWLRMVGMAVSVLVLAGVAGCSAPRSAPRSAAPAGGVAAPAGGVAAPAPSPAAPAPAEPGLNPRVAPPSPHVTAAHGLPVVAAPSGFLPPAEARERAFAIVDRRVHGGQLTLTAVRLSGDRWAMEFRADGRATTSSEGPGPPPDRWHEASHVVVVDRVTVELDGRTGELYSLGLTGLPGAPQEGLEHYRGRILLGGQQTRLRLVQPDGAREGREMTVLVDHNSLDRSGLALWQLTYGAGRPLDVWGLTAAEGEVVAARLSLAEPPEQSLPEHQLFEGVPLHPDAVAAKGIYRDRAVYLVRGATWEQVRDWYLQQMPRYGWSPQKGAGQETEGEYRWSFATAAEIHAEVRLRPHPDYTELTIIPESLAQAQ